MDPTLALLMANMAGCRPGSLVYDPFAGTGSLAEWHFVSTNANTKCALYAVINANKRTY